MRTTGARVALCALLLAGCTAGGDPTVTGTMPPPPPPAPSRPAAVASPAPPAPVPVLVVHGYGGSVRELAPIAARLRAAGRRVVLVTLPVRGTPPLERSVRALHAAALGTGAPRVDVVGFSLGGIVARDWAAGIGKGHARTVVQLASPNQGAVLGRARVDGGREVLCAPDNACGQLRPGSPYLARLARTRWRPDVRVVAVWSSHDRLVDRRAAALPGALVVELQRVCPDERPGHLGMGSHPAVLGAMLVALEGRSPLAYACAELTRRGRA